MRDLQTEELIDTSTDREKISKKQRQRDGDISLDVDFLQRYNREDGEDCRK